MVIRYSIYIIDLRRGKMSVFKNLKLLKCDMEKNGWIIDSFLFEYKRRTYVVIVHLYAAAEHRPKYALLKLEFLKEGKFSDSLTVAANSVKLFIEIKHLRDFFEIEYGRNYSDLIEQFNANFATFIPTILNNNKSKVEIEAISTSLSKSDSKDPKKIYCFDIKRNGMKTDGTNAERSIYNDNKARLLRGSLYSILNCQNEKNLSFHFSIDPQDEKTDEEIISNWAKRKR